MSSIKASNMNSAPATATSANDWSSPNSAKAFSNANTPSSLQPDVDAAESAWKAQNPGYRAFSFLTRQPSFDNRSFKIVAGTKIWRPEDPHYDSQNDGPYQPLTPAESAFMKEAMMEH